MTTYRKCLIRKKPLKNNGPQGADVEYGGEGVRRNRILEGFQSSPIVALTWRHKKENNQKHISRSLQKSTL